MGSLREKENKFSSSCADWTVYKWILNQRKSFGKVKASQRTFSYISSQLGNIFYTVEVDPASIESFLQLLLQLNIVSVTLATKWDKKFSGPSSKARFNSAETEKAAAFSVKPLKRASGPVIKNIWSGKRALFRWWKCFEGCLADLLHHHGNWDDLSLEILFTLSLHIISIIMESP